MLFISAWALTLSVQSNWAMRESQYVERTTDVSTLEPELNFADIDYQYVTSDDLMH